MGKPRIRKKNSELPKEKSELPKNDLALPRGKQEFVRENAEI